MRLISMLGFLTVIVLTCLIVDYFQVLRRPTRLGLGLAVTCIVVGGILVLNAVLPDSQFYGVVFSQQDTLDKVVALTFDDGPNPSYTGQLLDILRDNGVHATFFLIGRHVTEAPELVSRIAAEGHQIGNHTYNHLDLLKLDRRTVEAEIDKTNEAIAAITGSKPVLIRPPHGFRDAAVLGIIRDRGMVPVEWSVASRDWTNPGVAIIVRRTVQQVKNGSIILLHDGAGDVSRAQTIEATRRIIQELKGRGYRFVTVGGLLAMGENRQ